jgi:hypothetical protein
MIDNYSTIKTIGSSLQAKTTLAKAKDGTKVALKVYYKSNTYNTKLAL